MQVMAVVDHLNIGVFFDKVNVFGRNMRPVQIRDGNIIPMIL